MYRTHSTAGRFQYRLSRIVVNAPTKLHAKWPGQMVGWRFKMQQAPMAGLGYHQIFAGRVHSAIPAVGQPAEFSAKHVDIVWKQPIQNFDQIGPFYRIIAKFYWFRPDGSVRGLERHLLSPYNMYVDGVKTAWLIYGGCYELWPNLPI